MAKTNEPKYKQIVSITDTRSPATEEFRVLRTNLQFMGVEKGLKKILVTSAHPKEGKTTICANLGVVIAQTGKKVIIIDCDLRRPSLHSTFEETLTPGLTSYFTQEKEDIKGLIKKTQVEGLDIVTAGAIPPNPSELLASLKMKSFIDKIMNDYDFVIIDTSPSAQFADAATLSKNTDGVLFVCGSGDAKKDYIKKAVDGLKKIDANILGVVVNKVSKKTMKYGYYDYANAYSYDYDNANEQL